MRATFHAVCSAAFVVPFVVWALGAPIAAQLRLEGPWSDGMVVQRDRTVSLRGSAQPGAEVVVTPSWDGAEAIGGQVGEDGAFRVAIPTPGAGGPYRIEIRCGPESLILDDVLVGDVWLCSGQSNMEMPLVNIGGSYTGVRNGKAEIAAADHPRLRLFTVPNVVTARPQRALRATWQVCSPRTVERFSATGYFFGRALQQRLDVPIGLISADWGGTPIEAWTSRDGLAEFAEFGSAVEALRNAPSAKEHGTALAAWNEQANERDDGQPRFSLPEFDDHEWAEITVPGAFAGELAAFDGFVWLRRRFTLPEALVGKELVLELGPIDDQDCTYWNGREIGRTLGAGRYREPRRYRVPASDVRDVCLAIRVHDLLGPGGLTGRPASVGIHPIGAQKPRLDLAGSWRAKASTPQAKLPPQPTRMRPTAHVPTALYNGMIAPLRGTALRGVIWYQGESNRPRAAQYRRLLPAWMADWRRTFEDPSLWFHMVQIAPFDYRGDTGQAAALRAAQWDAAQADPRCGIAITMDIGNPRDIHPTNKQDVGKRLALCALAGTYGLDVVASGPVFAGMEIADGKARVRFRETAGGLVAGAPRITPTSRARPKTQLTHFTIAGADGKFHPATAVIDGDSVVVQSDQVAEPVAVRYAQGAADEPNLRNGAGLPAVPFRTDAR